MFRIGIIKTGKTFLKSIERKNNRKRALLKRAYSFALGKEKSYWTNQIIKGFQKDIPSKGRKDIKNEIIYRRRIFARSPKNFKKTLASWWVGLNPIQSAELVFKKGSKSSFLKRRKLFFLGRRIKDFRIIKRGKSRKDLIKSKILENGSPLVFQFRKNRLEEVFKDIKRDIKGRIKLKANQYFNFLSKKDLKK